MLQKLILIFENQVELFILYLNENIDKNKKTQITKNEIFPKYLIMINARTKSDYRKILIKVDNVN